MLNKKKPDRRNGLYFGDDRDLLVIVVASRALCQFSSWWGRHGQ